jgi:DNA-binding beta-propeller fold protein YncE
VLLLLASALLLFVTVAATLQPWPRPPAHGPVWPPPPDPVRIRFVTVISEPKDIGAGPSWLGRALGAVIGRSRQPHLLHPRALVADSTGRLIITDPEQRMVHVFDVPRRKYSYLASPPFASPVGIAVGPDDAIYVTDSGRRRVFVFDNRGKLKATFGVVRGEPIFIRPTGIAIGADGRVFVVDTAGSKISVLSPSGDLLGTFGRRGAGPAEFNFPTDIALDRQGRLFVLDTMNARVQVLEPDGTFVREFGRRGNGTGDFDKPKGLAFDSDGHIYVAESLHDVFQVFDQEGRLLLVVGGSGPREGQFTLPSFVHIDAADRVYVADALNGRVQVFQYVRDADAH